MPNVFLDELILERQARDFAERPAVVSGQRTISYAELADHVSAFAGTLQRSGVTPGAFVVVLTSPTPWIHVAALAILRLGAIYVPLDPDYPDTQLHDRLSELERIIVVASSEEASRAQTWGHPVVVLDPTPTGSPVTEAVVRSADARACVFFTSGSTGKPKATIGSVEAVVRSVVEPMEFLQLTSQETINSIARYSWSISLLELFGPLVFGGTCLLLDRLDALSTSALAEAAAKTTGFHCPPALLSELTKYLEEHPTQSAQLARVRLVWYGGDTIAPGVLDRCRKVFPSARLATAYGCTEIFGLSHAHVYEHSEPLDHVSIGRPAPGVLELLDGAGDLRELWLGGPRVALGYRNRPELNSERFLTRDGIRYYRTGDYVRRDARGNLVFVERQDGQVKIRGIRVEIGEVEATLQRTPGVADGLVLALDAPGGTKELHAFFVPSEAGSETAGNVRHDLAGRLPEHLVPARFHQLTAFPMTPNFKIDRKALIEHARKQSEVIFDDPDLARVAVAWQNAGADPSAGAQASFFEHGGDSLSAARLAAELSRVYGVTVEVADVFGAPTMSAQVERLLALNSKKAAREASTVAVEAQRGVFFRELFEGKKGTISCTRYIRCSEGFDDEAVRHALVRLVERFPTLRTGLRPQQGNLMLVPRGPEAAGTPSFQRVPGAWSLKPDQGAPMVQKHSVRFELASGALVGAVVSRLVDGSDLLQLTAHHVAADDNSTGRLALDFIELYDAERRRRPASLLPVPPAFADFCTEQRAQLTAGAYTAAASKLGARLLDQLRKAPSPLIQDAGNQSPATHTVVLPPGYSPRFSDVVAALARALSELSGRDEFVFCAHVALRRDEPQTPRVGMFVNLLPVFCTHSRQATQSQLAASAARSLREAMARSDVPYELILRSDPALRRLGRFPFDAFVNELRFDGKYPRGYEDVYVRRSFATDAHEISLSVVRRSPADELHFEAPGGPEVPALLEQLGTSLRQTLA